MLMACVASAGFDVSKLHKNLYLEGTVHGSIGQAQIPTKTII
jgi:hypothetical protein